MAPVYSTLCVTNRMTAVLNLCGSGFLVLLAGGTTIASVPLAGGAVNAGVLTFNGPLSTTATGTGAITSAKVTDANGNLVFTDASVGIPLSGADVTISTGDNSVNVAVGQTVSVLAAQIVGS
jgi:hypothetical protein